MLKLKQNHTSRDVKVLTDQLVDAVASVGIAAITKGSVTLQHLLRRPSSLIKA